MQTRTKLTLSATPASLLPFSACLPRLSRRGPSPLRPPVILPQR